MFQVLFFFHYFLQSSLQKSFQTEILNFYTQSKRKKGNKIDKIKRVEKRNKIPKLMNIVVPFKKNIAPQKDPKLSKSVKWCKNGVKSVSYTHAIL